MTDPSGTDLGTKAFNRLSATCLALFALIWLVPFAWAVITSLRPNEDITAMTPERLAALEAAESDAHDGGDDVLESLVLDEVASPVAGRRFSRA